MNKTHSSSLRTSPFDNQKVHKVNNIINNNNYSMDHSRQQIKDQNITKKCKLSYLDALIKDFNKH